MTQTSEHSSSSSADRPNQPIVWTELGVSGFKSFAEETRIKRSEERRVGKEC